MHLTDIKNGDIDICEFAFEDKKALCYVKGKVGHDANGRAVIEMNWQPNKEDMDAIALGLPITLRLYSQVVIPVWVYTCDEKGVPNT